MLLGASQRQQPLVSGRRNRITSAPSQKNANSSHVPPMLSGRIRCFASDMPSRPTTPLSVTESKPSALIIDARAPARYFLDICAGRSAPLSVAAIRAGLAVLELLDADPLLGGETHDLTDPNVADYVLQLTLSGYIGFAAEAPRRSDPHAEIFANRKPWQQNDRLIYQNVTAILTAVHANGGHVLWAIQPFSVASHMDFMQDFLSNIATYWLWVDACQFDVDEDTSPSDFSGRDHNIDAHDVVRGQTRYHCKQDFSSISLERAHRSNQGIQQYPRSRPAQASSLKVYLLPKAPRNVAESLNMSRNQRCSRDTPYSRSFPNTDPTTQPGRHGRHEATHLSCRKAQCQHLGRRPSLFCSQQDPDIGFIDIA